MDIREVNMKEKFDVVINMADGAIGYLKNDMENMKIFEVVSNALKKGGKHFMDIMNGSYAKPISHVSYGTKVKSALHYLHLSGIKRGKFCYTDKWIILMENH